MWRNPNSILFHYFLSLKHLPVSRYGFRNKIRCFFSCRYSSKGRWHPSSLHFLPYSCIFFPFSFSQKFGYFVFRYHREHCRHPFLEFIHSRLATVARLLCLYLETRLRLCSGTIYMYMYTIDIQLTPDNSNLALTRTKIDFPCISVMHLL